MKNLKENQKKQWVRGLLEKQMEQENMKRLESREERLKRAGVTFGPIETEETLMHQKIKKMRDIENTKTLLNSQIDEQNLYSHL